MSSIGFARVTSLVALSLIGACASSGEARSAADTEGESASKRDAERQSAPSELTPAEVVIKLRGIETDLRRCFFANPSARGTLSLSWRVNSEGRIEELKRERSTLDDPRIAECLAEKLYEVRFDPRPEPAKARWTFVFRLVEAPKSGGHKRSPSKRERDQREASEQGVQLEKTSPGTLDLAAVDNVVESGFPLFARCYRDGVSRNSNLDGAVRLRFVVGKRGKVTVVEDGGSDLTDRQVVDCVAEGFYALRFPQPAKGDAHLIYRIHFDSG